MNNEIKLIKNNDNRTDSDLEWVKEFNEFLKGKVPYSITMGRGHAPKLSAKKAMAIIWYLQEHFPLLPDHIEKCDVCDELFDSYSEGLYWETKCKHYCGSCQYIVPENYDRGKK